MQELGTIIQAQAELSECTQRKKERQIADVADVAPLPLQLGVLSVTTLYMSALCEGK